MTNTFGNTSRHKEVVFPDFIVLALDEVGLCAECPSSFNDEHTTSYAGADNDSAGVEITGYFQNIVQIHLT